MKWTVKGSAHVEIVIRDGSDAITRVTGPTGDSWRAAFYPLYTDEAVLAMWVDNAIRNGVRDANRLDGWGDLEDGEVTMEVLSSVMLEAL